METSSPEEVSLTRQPVLECAFEPDEHFRLALAAKDRQCLLAATTHHEHLHPAILVPHHQPKG
jgi:hypothetical protein